MPHDKIISARKGDIGRCTMYFIVKLHGIVENTFQIFNLYHIITCRFPIPIGFKVTHTLFFVLLSKVGDIGSVRTDKFDVLRNVRPNECNRLDKHIKFGVAEFAIFIFPEGINNRRTLLVDFLASVTPIDLVRGVSVHEAVPNFTITFGDNVAVFIYPPVNKLAHPAFGVRVTRYPESVADMRRITVVCE